MSRKIKWIFGALLATVLAASCSSTPESDHPRSDQTHPSAYLTDQFFPDQGMPTGESGAQEFFSKKCSPRSPTNHYSKTEYMCDYR